MKSILKLALVAMLVSVVSISANAQEETMAPPVADKNILETAGDAGIFGTLLRAVSAADLNSMLQGSGPYTVFAPSDDAFSKMPEGSLENMMADKELLKTFILYHIVEGEYTGAEASSAGNLNTAEGSSVNVTGSGTVRVNDATVVDSDIKASNGVIHVIDNVLWAPSLR